MNKDEALPEITTEHVDQLQDIDPEAGRGPVTKDDAE